MKKIRVYYVDTSRPIEGGIILDDRMQFIHERLSQYYEVELDPLHPQIVFGDIYDCQIMKYNAIRVSVCAEEYAPDFNVYDYAITILGGFSFYDRVLCLRAPIFYEPAKKSIQALAERKPFTQEDLEKKTGFCSFVQSKGQGADPIRIEFFNKLCEYKKVDSGGRLLNNIGGPVADKAAFEASHKFSISFINGRNYTLQDRPLGAFAAGTLPIYWGNPAIGDIYNSKAFVNCMAFPTMEDAIEEIKRIDQDDERYIAMMNEPVFREPISYESELELFDQFLIHIVEHGTVQRSGVYWNKVFEKAAYAGRKEYTRLYRAANFIRPVTKIIFASELGRKIKQCILKVCAAGDLKKAYKKL